MGISLVTIIAGSIDANDQKWKRCNIRALYPLVFLKAQMKRL